MSGQCVTSDDCPRVPTAQGQPFPKAHVSDDQIREFSAWLFEQDGNNAVNYLRVSPRAHPNRRYLWMAEQTFSKGPKAPIFYNAAFTGIGVFLRRIKFCHNLICY